MITDRLTFWIIGAGKFGTKAVERLHKKRPGASFTVVDQDAEALKRLDHLPAEKVCKEGASYLEAHLDTQIEPDWIIPAVPVHLAFEWVRLKLSNHGRIQVLAVPEEIEKMLPNPIRGPQGQLFVSYADFRCPDNCTEPIDRCTFTGKPRKGLLYKRIEEISYKDFRSIVIQSHQLAPGVGGYQPEALKKSFAEVTKTKTPVIYSTACLCHGVMHAFRLM
ncbi:MAG: potassium transporter [Deltaproteobacteria bacterium]|nr:potassium transporter [Deltaproteobacteria bacterium]MBW2018404.1 potassium transporter [Deltaproteobacteria bacterium]MBW2073690.1 potassium transporter [Deltaproteobacteria bacterium]